MIDWFDLAVQRSLKIAVRFQSSTRSQVYLSSYLQSSFRAIPCGEEPGRE